jgi:hypothetical protein
MRMKGALRARETFTRTFIFKTTHEEREST